MLLPAGVRFSYGVELNGRKLGLILNVGGYHKNVFNMAPSLEISYSEMDLAYGLLDQLISRCK